MAFQLQMMLLSMFWLYAFSVYCMFLQGWLLHVASTNTGLRTTFAALNAAGIMPPASYMLAEGEINYATASMLYDANMLYDSPLSSSDTHAGLALMRGPHPATTGATAATAVAGRLAVPVSAVSRAGAPATRGLVSDDASSSSSSSQLMHVLMECNRIGSVHFSPTTTCQTCRRCRR